MSTDKIILINLTRLVKAGNNNAISQAIKNKKPYAVPGEMGRRDVKYLQAIYKAMRTGQRIEIPKGSICPEFGTNYNR